MLAQEIPSFQRQSLACGKYQGSCINNGGTDGSENFCRLRSNRNSSRTAFRFGLIAMPVINHLRPKTKGLAISQLLRDLQLIAQPKIFAAWLRPMFHQHWVVYLKRPFGGPEYVLQYLGRYTHRVAISNHRLVYFANDQVTFRWRDSAHNNEQKLMPLSLDQFLRRFLLHILPQGFVRIRNFGFLANRRRATLLPLCFHLLGSEQQLQAEQNRSSTKDSSDLWHCPKCAGPMKVIERLTAAKSNSARPRGHGGSMNALPPIRILRVPRHGSHFFALSSNNSLLPASTTTVFTILFCRNQVPHASVTRCNLALARGEPARRSFPSLNFHRARVRRKLGGHVQAA